MTLFRISDSLQLWPSALSDHWRVDTTLCTFSGEFLDCTWLHRYPLPTLKIKRGCLTFPGGSESWLESCWPWFLSLLRFNFGKVLPRLKVDRNWVFMKQKVERVLVAAVYVVVAQPRWREGKSTTTINVQCKKEKKVETSPSHWSRALLNMAKVPCSSFRHCPERLLPVFGGPPCTSAAAIAIGLKSMVATTGRGSREWVSGCKSGPQRSMGDGWKGKESSRIHQQKLQDHGGYVHASSLMYLSNKGLI